MSSPKCMCIGGCGICKPTIEMFAPYDQATQDQIAHVLLTRGTPAQVDEALEYAGIPKPRPAEPQEITRLKCLVSDVANEVCKRDSRIDDLEAQVKHWRSNHNNMVTKCAFLSQRLDLPVDRIPEYMRTTAVIEQLQTDLAAAKERLSKLVVSCENDVKEAEYYRHLRDEGTPELHISVNGQPSYIQEDFGIEAFDALIGARIKAATTPWETEPKEKPAHPSSVNGKMTDEELIGYCDMHCKTERALFHADHINRMIALAGVDAFDAFGWHSMHDEMQELVDLAKKKAANESP